MIDQRQYLFVEICGTYASSTHSFSVNFESCKNGIDKQRMEGLGRRYLGVKAEYGER